MSPLDINNKSMDESSSKETKTHTSKNKISLLLLRTKICFSTCFNEITTCNIQFNCISSSTADKIVRVVTTILSVALISVALSLLFFLTYVFFNIYLEILLTSIWIKALHTIWVLFLICNITFNYYQCVMTKHGGDKYESVVRELANVTGFDYPETKEERLDWKKDYQRKISARKKKLRNDSAESSSTATTTTVTTTTTDIESLTKTTTTKRKNTGSNNQSSTNGDGNNDSFKLNPKKENINEKTKEKKPPGKIYTWMLLGPQEWGYCFRSNQPKPPRSHYEDFVGDLVLNMDHFCPWMFNTIGYFNYRYFVNVLIYAFIGMVYGSLATFHPFWYSFMDKTLTQQQSEMSRDRGYTTEHHFIPLVPTTDEHVFILITFIICSALATGVFALMSFHIYLTFTAQTTIECHGNYTKKRKAKREGKTWKNPYDLGWKLNWQQVYGSQHPFIAMLPSSRQPEFLPVPIDGKLHRRQRLCWKYKEDRRRAENAV